MIVDLKQRSNLTLEIKEPITVSDLSYAAIVVPRGFITDLASVPRIFWSIIPPFGKYARAAIVHDYLYVTTKHNYTRKQADDIFLDIMRRDRVSMVKRYAMYYAVRLFAKKHWAKL